MASAPSAPVGDKIGAKDDARDHRLRRTNTIKERIFVEWQKLCLKTCDDDVRDYWICRQEAGLMTPLRCQPQNTVMQACLSVCTNDEANFRVYKARRLDEIEALALGRSETLAAAPKPGAGQ